ncbi:MAG: 6-phosphofructokinase [Fusobacteriaceae bacterium]|nr:6-phosphofructokinase [Fusobacteriaceae bacterium]MBP6467713.1 6-phosphofructokinase [Fusobacteriaceae bacterium]MBP9595300.1 6-phosphofructokinase [Fusobacteriaceae bacterium]MBU9917431.1 6-phosphofructokinase [Fusobacteriaceae bacterium]
MKNIAILTSGGDAPGMNAAIRSAAKYAMSKGIKVYGIRRGYAGMLHDEIFEMTSTDVSGVVDRGGTFLLTARLPEFKQPEVRAQAAAKLKAKGIEGLVVIGGDGSFHGADFLYKEHGIKAIGIPGTIDNDIAGSDYTIGYDTTLNIILDAMGKLRDTATSHERTYLLEVMGRHAGDLALYSCLAGGGDGLLIPEKGYSIDELANQINQRRAQGKLHDIIVVAEGVGSAFDIAKDLKDKVKSEMRVTVLGHIQRGGTPSALDRIIATKMGAYAVDLLLEGTSGVMVGIESNKLVTYPISHAWEAKKVINEKDYELALILGK